MKQACTLLKKSSYWSLLSHTVMLHQLEQWAPVKSLHFKASHLILDVDLVFCVVLVTIGRVCFFLPWWMSKSNFGTNSSGTGSFPNVITVNMITVQMNVNSSTINVQVVYCVYTVTQQAPNLSLSRVWCSCQPTAFCIFISYCQWTLPYMQPQD